MGNIIIYSEIQKERDKQDNKWGVQDHDSVNENISYRSESNLMAKRCRMYGIADMEKAKYQTNTAANNGEITWSHIAVEELSEVICALDETHRREELIQLAAVCVAWIESIDRKNINANGE